MYVYWAYNIWLASGLFNPQFFLRKWLILWFSQRFVLLNKISLSLWCAIKSKKTYLMLPSARIGGVRYVGDDAIWACGDPNKRLAYSGRQQWCKLWEWSLSFERAMTPRFCGVVIGAWHQSTYVGVWAAWGKRKRMRMRMSATEVGLYDYDILHIKGIYIYIVVLNAYEGFVWKLRKKKVVLYENISEFWVLCT